MQAHYKMSEYIAHRILRHFSFADPEGLISDSNTVTSDLQAAVSALRITDRKGQSYRITIEAE